MTINGKREFTYNGNKYRIQDACKADIVDGKKYFVTFLKNGFYETAYNKLGYEIDFFKTIKDAQRYVRDNDFLLDTLY